VVAGAFVGEVDDARGDLAQKAIAHLAAKKELVGVTIQKESKARVEPGPTK
jgi:hypothetical protein